MHIASSNETVTKCHAFKMNAPDGKMRLTIAGEYNVGVPLMKPHILFAQRLTTLMDTKFNILYKSNVKNLASLYPFVDPEILIGVVCS